MWNPCDPQERGFIPPHVHIAQPEDQVLCSTLQAGVERPDGGELAGGWHGHPPAEQDNLQLHRDAGCAGSPRLQSPCGPPRPDHAGAPQPESLSSFQVAMQMLHTLCHERSFIYAVTLTPEVNSCNDWEIQFYTAILIRSIRCTCLLPSLTKRWHLMLRCHMPAFERTTGHCFLTSKAT